MHWKLCVLSFLIIFLFLIIIFVFCSVFLLFCWVLLKPPCLLCALLSQLMHSVSTTQHTYHQHTNALVFLKLLSYCLSPSFIIIFVDSCVALLLLLKKTAEFLNTAFFLAALWSCNNSPTTICAKSGLFCIVFRSAGCFPTSRSCVTTNNNNEYCTWFEEVSFLFAPTFLVGFL